MLCALYAIFRLKVNADQPPELRWLPTKSRRICGLEAEQHVGESLRQSTRDRRDHSATLIGHLDGWNKRCHDRRGTPRASLLLCGYTSNCTARNRVTTCYCHDTLQKSAEELLTTLIQLPHWLLARSVTRIGYPGIRCECQGTPSSWMGRGARRAWRFLISRIFITYIAKNQTFQCCKE
jgi:hypothetical protein